MKFKKSSFFSQKKTENDAVAQDGKEAAAGKITQTGQTSNDEVNPDIGLSESVEHSIFK